MFYLEVLMREFCEYCSEDFTHHFYNCMVSKNTNTRTEYIGYINLLCNYLCKDFQDITYEDASKYLNYMNSKRIDGKLTRRTITVRLACYNTVALYLEEKCEDYRNPFSKLVRPEVRQEFDANRIPSMEELDLLFSEAQKDPQDFLVLALATRVGLSAANILRLTTKSIVKDTSDGSISLHFEPKSGFSKDTYVRLPEDVRDILVSYIEYKNYDDSDEHPLFINKWKRPLTIQNVDQLIKRLTDKCGLEDYTLKDFRNRAILEMVNAGASMEEMSEYTGLKRLRLEKFFENKSLVSRACPAELVNYRLINAL